MLNKFANVIVTQTIYIVTLDRYYRANFTGRLNGMETGKRKERLPYLSPKNGKIKKGD
jgi:hypothetical protein